MALNEVLQLDERHVSTTRPKAAEITQAVALLDQWLETARGIRGYAGPVVHWWRSNLLFTGTGLDWRYEGIIVGYLQLYARTGHLIWLTKARRAGNDLIRGQLPAGHYRNSCFELNPYPGGTPHEAACDLALLHLAAVLHEEDDPGWTAYLKAARRNIERYFIGQLWDPEAQLFRDAPAVPSFVPNKAATLAEALFALAGLTGDEELISRYALPTLDAIIAHQVHRAGDPLDGAIRQNQWAGQPVERFFPLYIARCVPALIQGYNHTADPRYLDAAHAALAFVVQQRSPDGSFPQVIYHRKRRASYPRWIAAVGDILRAIDLLQPHGFNEPAEPTLSWLLSGQACTGGFRTAAGFASQAYQGTSPGQLEFRDLLPVCGWIDKAFRYLTGLVEGPLPHMETTPFETPCTFAGQTYIYRETANEVILSQGDHIVYHWWKGRAWAQADPWLWIR